APPVAERSRERDERAVGGAGGHPLRSRRGAVAARAQRALVVAEPSVGSRGGPRAPADRPGGPRGHGRRPASPPVPAWAGGLAGAAALWCGADPSRGRRFVLMCGLFVLTAMSTVVTFVGKRYRVAMIDPYLALLASGGLAAWAGGARALRREERSAAARPLI